jgi:hypothetical protein
MRTVLPLLVTLLLGVLGVSACARDCATLVERRCQEPGVTAEQCARLKERAAALPQQACEALLYAREKGSGG